MDVKLPERTARDLDWHDGVKLWVKTLNLWERDEAGEAADIWGHGQVRQYRPGGACFEMLQERFGGISSSDRAAYLAEAGLRDGSFAAVALERFPDPTPLPSTSPQSDLGTPGSTAGPSDLDVWEIARATAVACREELIRDKYDTALAHASGLGVAEARDRCVSEFIARRASNLRGFRLVCETIQRAARLEADHSARFFADVALVMELSDGERDYLWSAYVGMQLSSDQVPTSAAVSLG